MCARSGAGAGSQGKKAGAADLADEVARADEDVAPRLARLQPPRVALVRAEHLRGSFGRA